jgi:TfoX/Sxy family transcriptional regulator of competence genes
MFGGVAFMVNGKMCITVGKDRIMCRIDPGIQDEAIKRKGIQTVCMGGRAYKGYVYIDEEAIKTKKAFDYWVELALHFNRIAKSSKES